MLPRKRTEAHNRTVEGSRRNFPLRRDGPTANYTAPTELNSPNEKESGGSGAYPSLPLPSLSHDTDAADQLGSKNLDGAHTGSAISKASMR